MRLPDLEAVSRLEAEAFAMPWSRQTFRELIELGGPDLLVAELPGLPVAGYAVLRCIEDQGELASIAVAPGCRGQGVGSVLLDAVLDTARAKGVAELFLEVRDSNERAIGMYQRRGFEQIGTRVAYYNEPKEDARVLRLRL